MVEAVVVDDSHFMRVQIANVLEAGGITVVDEARNGKEAVETVSSRQPDVVTMDVKMPGMDGIEAVERIMETEPTPILMLSRYTEDGAETTFEALEAGAIDFFRKPGGEVSTTLVQYADDLVEAVTLVAGADVSAPASQLAPEDEESPEAAEETRDPPTPSTVVIAASTGGPPEVQSILASLSPATACRVLVVQHMPENFTGRFAERLNTLCELDVREAEPQGTVSPGEVVIAKGGHHLDVLEDDGTTLQYDLTREEPVHSVRPAADITFESAARVCSTPLVAVVLSGMGSDGTAGAEEIAAVGGTVIAQDPDTARIGAMPARAIEAGVVDAVVPTRKIVETVLDAVTEP